MKEQFGILRNTSGSEAARVLFSVAFLIGFLQLLHPVGYGFGAGFESSAIARNIVSDGTFGNPFDIGRSGPTAVLPPLHPYFMAVFYWLLPLPWSLFAIILCNVIANAVTAALMPGLSRRFCGDAWPGVFAGTLWLFAMQLLPSWDAGFTLAALVGFLMLTADAFESGTTIRWAPAGAGLAAGIISSENPATVLVFGPWILFLLLRRDAKMQEKVRQLVVFALLVSASNLPWLIRNYRIWHVITLRTNFGMTFYWSNNDCAQSSLAKDIENGCYQRNHPAGSTRELALMKKLGEVEFDRERTNATLAWIRSNPARFMELTLARIREFWFPDIQVPVYTKYAIWFITALSVPGVLMMLRNRLPIAWLLLFLWLVYPLTYYVVVSGGRYRYPILWSSLLPAGYFLSVCWSYTAEAWPSATGETALVL